MCGKFGIFERRTFSISGGNSMKKILAILLLLSFCISLCSCSLTKSAEAKHVDDLILAIGEVTVDSEPAIMEAQASYDALTESQKSEVDNYDILTAAHETLAQKKSEAQHTIVMDLLEQGDYLQASTIIYEHTEFADYDALVAECSAGVLPQYIMENGEERDPGMYVLTTPGPEDGELILLIYGKTANVLQLGYYSRSDYNGMTAVEDELYIDYYIGESEMTFSRFSATLGEQVNYQEGTISLAEYTGSYSGDISENSAEALVIPGFTVTAYETAYEKQTRLYHVASVRYINAILETAYGAVVSEGYPGTMNDLGFIAYEGMS